jgi:hypothetical protein
MKHVALFIFAFLFSLHTIDAQQADTERFVKPMKLKPSVSGSFGELRSNHFHSGLDLTTNQKTGYRIYASDKGYVSRIKVSPYGYGKAIYINHEGGYTTVYAHLDRFASKIDSIVKAGQYNNQSYSFEQFYKPGEIPIERAEVIAYSGNSGSSGGPHLHYEVRDQANQKPINPLFFRDDIEDDVRPQIQGMKLYCLSDDATINNLNKDKYTPVVFYEKSFHPKGTKSFKAHGKIGVGVQVLDYFTDSWRKCGITSIDLFVNDSLVYNFNIQKFSFAESRYINSHIDYAEKIRSGKVIQKSWVEPNNQLSLYGAKNTYTDIIKPGDQKHFKYVIKDYAGNTSILRFNIEGIKAPATHTKKKPPLMDINFEKSYKLDTLGMQVNLAAKTFYTNIGLFLHKDEKNGLISPVYHIGDRHIPLHRSMTVSVPVPDSLMAYKDKLLMAGLSSSGKTYSLGGSFKNNRVETSTRSFGRFTLAIDSIPPVVKLRKAPAGNNYSNRKNIEVIISDSFSGIKKYNCLIDDQWALFEYDAKNKRLTGTFKDMPFLKKGSHQLKVIVTDNKGNETSKLYTFKN